ncbi:hypothetical protein GQ473_00555 [archaeon]|nr:hypothetical protein [archaeon]
MAAKKKTTKNIKKTETKTQTKPKKQLISMKILNTEVLNFIMTVVILALLVFYLVPQTNTNSTTAPIELEENCKTLSAALESQGIEFSRVDEKGICYITQEQPIPDVVNNQTIIAKIERELGIISNIKIESGIEQQPMIIQ